MQENYDREQRKRHLRRLDAILTALEELNLKGGQVPQRLVKLLEDAGLANAASATVSELIDRVLAMQQPFLVKVQIDRRRRRRRAEAAAETQPVEPGAITKAS